jgi:hypothetical protein
MGANFENLLGDKTRKNASTNVDLHQEFLGQADNLASLG